MSGAVVIKTTHVLFCCTIQPHAAPESVGARRLEEAREMDDVDREALEEIKKLTIAGLSRDVERDFGLSHSAAEQHEKKPTGINYPSTITHKVFVKELFYRSREEKDIANSELRVLYELRGLPNIVRILNFFYNTEKKRLTMIFGFRQTNLNDWRYALQQPDYASLVVVLRGIAEGVRSVHSKNYVLFDMRPENIMLGAAADVVLIDFALTGTEGFVSEYHNHSIWMEYNMGNTVSEETSMFHQTYQKTHNIYTFGKIACMVMTKLVAYRITDHHKQQFELTADMSKTLKQFDKFNTFSKNASDDNSDASGYTEFHQMVSAWTNASGEEIPKEVKNAFEGCKFTQVQQRKAWNLIVQCCRKDRERVDIDGVIALLEEMKK